MRTILADESYPIERRQAMGRAGAAQEEIVDAMQKCLLIADRSSICREGWWSLLNSQFEVKLEAQDGRTAIAVALTQQPDLALVQTRLPGLGGVQTAKYIKRLVPHTSVVVTLEDTTDADVRKALAAGADGCVDTNIRPKALRFAIRTAMASASSPVPHSNRARLRSGRRYPASSSMSHEQLVAKLDRLERACWRGGQLDAARLLSAVKLAHIDAGSAASGQRQYLKQLVHSWERAETDFVRRHIAPLFEAAEAAGEYRPPRLVTVRDR